MDGRAARRPQEGLAEAVVAPAAVVVPVPVGAVGVPVAVGVEDAAGRGIVTAIAVSVAENKGISDNSLLDGGRQYVSACME